MAAVLRQKELSDPARNDRFRIANLSSRAAGKQSSKCDNILHFTFTLITLRGSQGIKVREKVNGLFKIEMIQFHKLILNLRSLTILRRLHMIRYL